MKLLHPPRGRRRGHLACAAALSLLPSLALAQAGLTINPEALWTTGQIFPGAWMLPSGRLISPVGTQVTVAAFPMNVVVSPDGKYAVVTCAGPGQHQVQVVDLTLKRVVDSEAEESLWQGLAFSPDGRTLYASNGGSDEVLVYDFSAGSLTYRTSYEVHGHPAGLAVSPDGSELLVVSNIDAAVTLLDAETGANLGDAKLDEDPFEVEWDPDGMTAYVTEERDGNVAVIDLADGRPSVLTRIRAKQKSPNSLLVSDDGSTLYVANADQDTVSVVDLATYTVERNIDLRPVANGAYGSLPNAMAFSPDGGRLYVSQGLENRIAVIDVPSAEVLGFIPTGWLPTAVAFTPNGATMVISNGNAAGGTNKSLDNPGSVSIATTPTDSQLAQLTADVIDNNSYPGRLFTTNSATWNNPVPLTRGGPTPIKHVVLLVRENKTYDSVLGDYAGGNGVASNCVYCGDATPNLRTLAQRFSLATNYYNSVEESDQGHMQLTSTTVNMYSERITWPNERAPMFLEIFLNPTAWPKNYFLFQHMIDAGIDLRIYGEAIGTGVDWLIFDTTYVHWGRKDPPFFWMFSEDVEKIDERITKDWDKGVFPSFIYMLLPNDHTNGCQWPFPTPISMVADNDEATGRFVEWLRDSPYWNDTVVFMVEDDPQTGSDHIDYHRGPMMAFGRYVKKGYVSPVRYSEANLHATIEYILGLPPMSPNDEIAQPMWDLFTSTPNDEDFTHTPRIIPPEQVRPGGTCSRRSREIDFSRPDASPELGPILVEYEQARHRANPRNPTGLHVPTTAH